MHPGLECGAVVEFTGRVRPYEGRVLIQALRYEAYESMAEREMRRILLRLGNEFPCLHARVIHRVGVIPVGEAAIYLSMSARHRSEAFGMAMQFMDELKKHVPIWKTEAIE